MTNDSDRVQSAQEFANQATELYNELIRSDSADTDTCDQIISLCQTSIERFPNPDAYALLSRAIHLKSSYLPKDRERLNLHLLALNYAAKSIELLPQSAPFHFWRAELLFEIVVFSQSKQEAQGRFEEAEKEYQITLELDPNHRQAQESLQELIIKKEKLANKSIKANPEALLEYAWECFYKREWEKLLQVCKDILAIDGLNAEQEASCRKLYANAFAGRSFEDKANALPLRKEAVAQARKSIELYGSAAEPSSLSDAYDTLGTALQIYSFVLPDESEKDRYFQEGTKAFQKALEIDPSNRQAIDHLERAKGMPAKNSATGKTSGCFIATAVYGSYESIEVRTLRKFRDDVLLKSDMGTRLVGVYYSVSPQLAKIIKPNSFLKRAIRGLILDPLVKYCTYRSMES